MSSAKRVLTYSNVVATIALFMAISGGVVYAANKLGKNAVKSSNIAKNAVKTKNIASNAVTTAKIKKEAVTGAKVKKATLTRTSLAAGTLAGLQVASAQSASVPGLTTESSSGTPVPLTGTATFFPVAGKSYELLTEMKGTPTDADGTGNMTCSASVTVLDNGAPVAGTSIYANASAPAPFNNEPVGGSSVPLGILSPGQGQALSVISFGSPGCSSATTAALSLVVVEFG